MRRGLTLLEMLIVIAILGLLMALLLPAVQSTRESGRRIVCSSQLRQIALAIHAYEEVHSCFPPASANTYSYLFSILPFVEQNALYAEVRSRNALFIELPVELKRVRVSVYQCPSDSFSRAQPYATNYVGNMGYDPLTLGLNGVFCPPHIGGYGFELADFGVSPAGITDGLSNTALVGELLVSEKPFSSFGSRLRMNWRTAESFGAGEHDQFVAACLGQLFAVDSNGQAVGQGMRGMYWMFETPSSTLYTHSVTPNNLSCQNSSSLRTGAFTLASNHPGGVLVTFADGHTAFIDDSIATRAWRTMGTRAGGEASNGE